MTTATRDEIDESVGGGLMTVKAAALFLSLAESFVYRLIYEGAIPTVRVGRARRIPRRALEKFASDRLVRNETT